MNAKLDRYERYIVKSLTDGGMAWRLEKRSDATFAIWKGDFVALSLTGSHRNAIMARHIVRLLEQQRKGLIKHPRCRK